MSELESLMLDQIKEFGLPCPETEWRFCAARWRFDFAWPDCFLAVELDGGTWKGKSRHTSGVGYEQDCFKLNFAVLLGWRVLRFTRDQVERGEAMALIRSAFNLIDPQELLARRAEETLYRRSEGAKAGWETRKAKKGL
jgi:hypothetical protein